MVKTKGKQVVTSHTKSDRDHSPPPLKRHVGFSINESYDAPRHQPPTTPRVSTQERVQPKNGVVRKNTEI